MSSLILIKSTTARYQSRLACVVPSIINSTFNTQHLHVRQGVNVNSRNNNNFSTASARPKKITATLPEGYCPGLAYSILQKKGADTGFIQRKEFVDMCRASRAGKPRDAKMIVHALKYFKRTCDLAIDKRHAKVAVEGMIRSMLPRERERVKPKRLSDEEWEQVLSALQARRALDAALFCSDAILNKDTALYTSISTSCVNKVLGFMGSAADAGMFHPKVAAIGYREAEDAVADGTLAAKKEQVSKMLDGLTETLTTRSSKPERQMKKRAARKYLKQVKTTDGPDEETLALIENIRKGMEVEIEPEGDVDNDDEVEGNVEESDGDVDVADENNEQK